MQQSDWSECYNHDTSATVTIQRSGKPGYLMDTVSKRCPSMTITSMRQTADNGILSLNQLKAQCPYSMLTY